MKFYTLHYRKQRLSLSYHGNELACMLAKHFLSRSPTGDMENQCHGWMKTQFLWKVHLSFVTLCKPYISEADFQQRQKYQHFGQWKSQSALYKCS